MKITFFLLISPKCVRTHTLVYSLKHIFRIRISGVSLGVKGVKELKELRQQLCGLVNFNIKHSLKAIVLTPQRPKGAITPLTP